MFVSHIVKFIYLLSKIDASDLAIGNLVTGLLTYSGSMESYIILASSF